MIQLFMLIFIISIVLVVVLAIWNNNAKKVTLNASEYKGKLILNINMTGFNKEEQKQIKEDLIFEMIGLNKKLSKHFKTE